MERMRFSRFDEVHKKLQFLFDYVTSLKDENRELKRKVYSLEINLSQARAATESKESRRKFSALVEERDRLIMERELIRNKVKAALEKVGTLENNVNERP